MSLGDFIKEIRLNKNLSLREAARRADLSHPYLSQLENGKNTKPSPETLEKIATGLNVDYEMLLIETGYIKKDGAYWEGELSEEVKNNFILFEKPVDIYEVLKNNENVLFKAKKLTERDRNRLISSIELLLD